MKGFFAAHRGAAALVGEPRRLFIFGGAAAAVILHGVEVLADDALRLAERDAVLGPFGSRKARLHVLEIQLQQVGVVGVLVAFLVE